MFKALMVLCKVIMAAPGGKEAAQGCSYKEQLGGGERFSMLIPRSLYRLEALSNQ